MRFGGRQRFEQLRERRRFDLQRVGMFVRPPPFPPPQAGRVGEGAASLAEATAAGRDAAPANRRVDRQNEAAARNPPVEFEHDASHAGIDVVGISRERVAELDLDLAHVILADHFGTV